MGCKKHGRQLWDRTRTMANGQPSPLSPPIQSVILGSKRTAHLHEGSIVAVRIVTYIYVEGPLISDNECHRNSQKFGPDDQTLSGQWSPHPHRPPTQKTHARAGAPASHPSRASFSEQDQETVFHATLLQVASHLHSGTSASLMALDLIPDLNSVRQMATSLGCTHPGSAL